MSLRQIRRRVRKWLHAAWCRAKSPHIRQRLRDAMYWCWRPGWLVATVPGIGGIVGLFIGHLLGWNWRADALVAGTFAIWLRYCGKSRIKSSATSNLHAVDGWKARSNCQYAVCVGSMALFYGVAWSNRFHPRSNHVVRPGTVNPKFINAQVFDSLLVLIISICFAAFGLVVFRFLFLRSPQALPEFVHHRGTRLLEHREAQLRALARRAPDDTGIDWAGICLPSSFEKYSFLCVGIAGSGKTTIIKNAQQSVFRRRIRTPSRKLRSIVFDVKRDMVAHLAGQPIVGPIIIVNPFDARSYAWDIAHDAIDFAMIDELAKILIPDVSEHQPFFPDSARAIIAGVMKAFAETRALQWTFRDLLLAVSSVDALDQILSSSKYTVRLVQQYFRPRSVLANIVSTMASKLVRFEPIAAAWEHSSQKLRLDEWVQNESVLVLGHDDARRSGLEAINRVLFKRISELLLAGPDQQSDRTWIWLDEVRELGKLDGLHSLLVRGRSKAVTCCLGVQDYDGFRDAFGDKLAPEILGQSNVRTFLRVGSPATAQFASKSFGEMERWEYYESHTQGKKQSSTSTSEHLVKRDVAMASEFFSLPLGDWQRGFSSLNIAPSVGAYVSHVSAEHLREDLFPPNTSEPDYIQRPAWQLRLEPWTEEDLRRLGLPIALLEQIRRGRNRNRPNEGSDGNSHDQL